MRSSNLRKKTVAVVIIGVLFLSVAAALVYYIAPFLQADGSRWFALAGIMVVAGCVIAYICIETRGFVNLYRSGHTLREEDPEASLLVLLGESGVPVKMWDIKDKIGLVIGRSTDEDEVDIDLSESEYHAFISDVHAVLNFTENGWYIADASSKNGTSVKKRQQEQILHLTPGEPAPIKPGDIIYLASDTTLAVQ